jgi:hypothetical protein
MKNNLASIKKNSALLTLIILFSVMFIYISFIIYYLNNLVTCSCFEDKDIKYLINIEYFVLVLIFIHFISLYLITSGTIQNTSYLFIIPLLLLIFYIYIIYATINIYKNTYINCSCSMSIIRYMLYIQAIFLFSAIYSIITMDSLTQVYNNYKKKINNI